jgi:mercuric ion transport protein
MEPTLKTWAAIGGGLAGALAASACCVVPLVLLWLGISGAWIANLTALSAYHEYFIAVSVLLLCGGYYFVYVKSAGECEEGHTCARSLPDRLVKSSFWFAVIMVSIAAIFPYLVTLYYGG